ncbi:serine/threonine-protein kinase [Nocardia callitridis]|uniref:Serine/threonine-protein kinase PknG n=1 Tax=Nocardia callitridis TaxID=648753 RepID=A0ABP9KEB9_9NOCA
MPHPWTSRRSRNTEVPARIAHPWSGPRIAENRFATTEPPDTEPESIEVESEPESPSRARERVEDALLAQLESEPASGRSARSRPSVRRLGDGLVAMPKVSPLDPRGAMLETPEVPEHKRFCWKCEQPIGRTDEFGPGELSGVCGHCFSPFNFRPALQPGEIVSEQYEVQGCLAHGGLGWIYLAIDRNVSDRWVVLKGLQNPLDFEAHVVALAERQFLSEVAYPGIVKIHNFVKHRSTREVADGYIVMEYVGGRSLKKMLDLREPQRLPVSDAIAFMMEILPALDYLHSFGLAYNDLKPDNIMVSEDEVKLIDLGAVAAMESYGSIYGTPGYQAPEITDTGPTVASDIYTVGRTMAALITSLPKNAEGHYLPGIPTPEQEPLFARYPALYRLLLRATDAVPHRRFPSAYSMYCQLAGTLRMVLAADSGAEHPQASIEFGSMRGDFGIETLIGQTDGMIDGTYRRPELAPASVVEALPVPLMGSEDPSADLLSTLLHGDPRHALDTLRRTADRIVSGTIAEPETFELEGTLTAVRAHLDLGDVVSAGDRLADLRPRYSADWRVDWYSAIAALLDGQYERAFGYFDTVHGMLPGELAPALALAAAAELALQQGDSEDLRWHRLATEYYRSVWRTNHGVVSAAFGLARRLVADGALTEAVRVLDQVPAASRHYGVARMTGCLLLVSQPIAETSSTDLAEAATRLTAAEDEPRAPQLRVVIVGAALEWLRTSGEPECDEETILGYPVTMLGLRRGLETSLRTLARSAPHRLHRYQLIDLANSVRPKTRW